MDQSSNGSSEGKINYTKVFENLRFLRRNSKKNTTLPLKKQDSKTDTDLYSTMKGDFILKRVSDNSDKENNLNKGNTLTKNFANQNVLDNPTTKLEMQTDNQTFLNVFGNQKADSNTPELKNQAAKASNPFKSIFNKKHYSDTSDNSDLNSSDPSTPKKIDDGSDPEKKVK